MKTTREKLENAIKASKIVEIPKKMERIWGKGKLLIPNPIDIESLIKKTEKRKLITFKQIRDKLAEKFKVHATCPITTGIFSRLIAEFSEEENKNIPWWRVIRDDGSLNEKFPGNGKMQADYLKKEGISVLKEKNKFKVKDFEKYLK